MEGLKLECEEKLKSLQKSLTQSELNVKQLKDENK